MSLLAATSWEAGAQISARPACTCNGSDAREQSAQGAVRRVESPSAAWTGPRAGWTTLHAGLVSWRGMGVLLPGRSRSGKSTLVKELLALGAQLVTDEHVRLTRKGAVASADAALRLRADVRPEVLKRYVTWFAQGHLPIGLVAFLQYRRGASWKPVPLRGAMTVASALAHCLEATGAAARSLATLTEALCGAQGVASERGEAAATAESLLQLADILAKSRTHTAAVSGRVFQ